MRDAADMNGPNRMNGPNQTDGMRGGDGTDGVGGVDGKANQQMKHGDSAYDGSAYGGSAYDGSAYGDLTCHDLTHSTPVERGIALLLADAADDVEVGIAPYQAVVRGGRRRKARRWAVAAAAAVVIAGTTGTLALATVTDGDRGRVVPAASAPVPTDRVTPHARVTYEPSRTTLAQGEDKGTAWRMTIDVWDAPKDKAAAGDQLAAMALFGDSPGGVDGAADLVGKSWHFVHLSVGGERTGAMIDGEADALSGTDLEVYATPFGTGDRDEDDAPERLVVGQVAPTAQVVRVTWSDNTFVDVKRDRGDDPRADLSNPRIVEVEGTQASWFVALAPEGVGYRSAEVTK